MFYVSDTQTGSDYIVGRVVRLERFSKALGACEGKLIVDRNHYDLLVQMIDEVI